VTDLCTVADVEALLGYTIPLDQVPRVETLIGMASGVVGDLVVIPPAPATTPPAVAYVTASLVVRTMANPGQLTSEAIGTYKASYGAGMALSESDLDALGPWMPLQPGQRTFNACVPTAPPCGVGDLVPPPYDWERDLDELTGVDL
jgi:hypothetical protein